MKSALIISTFLAAASLALAIPYDWDPFMLDVTTTVAGVQKQREAVIKDIDEHPLLRQKHLEQVDQMIDDIIRTDSGKNVGHIVSTDVLQHLYITAIQSLSTLYGALQICVHKNL
ncbi:unnamed protein product [Medioppia subpectinata]|uniref:Uncharacterized protein n=1 Tax=Medioppia subpectinata TaxID=1979941 RepID=A0A7R9PZ63_9ACAR|nr:unnamed protein product [Medioppia subpectinata]CAG2106756.1 unnamed protein product [Medioppia subpectinata]